MCEGYYCIIHYVNTIFLSCQVRYDTLRGVRDKESTAITITLPVALDRALQALADQKHCGNKSAAIREALYKEAGMQAKLRMNDKKDSASVAKAESRSVKYGSRKKKNRK
jgi:predicted transcriptional regulator